MKLKITLIAALIATLTAEYALGQGAAQTGDTAAFEKHVDDYITGGIKHGV